MLHWWRRLSLIKKIYGVVRVMALLVAIELMILSFSMSTLSAIRSFVGGEGLWSKAQKSSVHSLHKYILIGDELYWRDFQNYLQIPLGDRKARLEMLKPQHDYRIFFQGFLEGHNHPDDIPGLYCFIRYFNQVSYVEEALEVWRLADEKLDELIVVASGLHHISKVEAGHLQIEKVPIYFPDFLVDLRGLVVLKAQQKSVSVRLDQLGEIPDNILTDALQLRQILLNLIGNAIKFTDGGEILVTHWVSQGVIYFRVKDSGIGLSQAEQKNLFSLFYQADASSTRKYEGTDLGLILSRQLARAMGGDVNLLESSPGVRSIFLAQVEFSEALEKKAVRETKSLAEASLQKVHGKKILVVEDNKDNHFIVNAFLKRHGIHVDFANNGLEGVQKSMAGGYDAVLMDMQMPVMDGYKATETLRQKGFRKPIIALTAHAMREEKSRCLQAGCDGYLMKPFDSKALIQTLVELI